MSLRDRAEARGLLSRRGLPALVATCAALALSACSGGGIQPLYGASASGVPVPERLEQVDVSPIPGRIGQRIRNELIFHNNGTHSERPSNPHERLEVVIKESVTSALVRSDGTSFSQIYQLEATFRLIDVESKKVVLEGRSFGRAAFERVQSTYANVRARQDAEDRAARTIADDLKIRLAAHFSRAKDDDRG